MTSGRSVLLLLVLIIFVRCMVWFLVGYRPHQGSVWFGVAAGILGALFIILLPFEDK